MKKLINKILKEETIATTSRKARSQWSPEAAQDLEAFHPDLFELGEQEETGGDGSWSNPIVNNTPGNVPTSSYEPHSQRGSDEKWVVNPVSKIAFYKATQILTKIKDSNWFTQQEDDGEHTYHRVQQMEMPLKVVGIRGSGIGDKVFWAASDNREGILDGSITNYDQLVLRAFVKYELPMTEDVRVYKTITYTPTIEAYSQEDAFNNISMDEDGAYSSGEWSNRPGYDEEEYDWDGHGGEIDGPIKVVSVLYPEESGLNESIIKEMGPGPEENDIMSELQELVNEWSGCEEGMPVACRYKNQVQELIEKYKSKPLN